MMNNTVDFTKPLELPDGRPVRLLGRVENNTFPWVIAFHGNGVESHKEFVDQVDESGCRVGMSTSVRNVPPKIINRTGYINIYRKPAGRYVCSPYPYFNREDAEDVASPDKGAHFIGTVTWEEVEDGNE